MVALSQSYTERLNLMTEKEQKIVDFMEGNQPEITEICTMEHMRGMRSIMSKVFDIKPELSRVDYINIILWNTRYELSRLSDEELCRLAESFEEPQKDDES